MSDPIDELEQLSRPLPHWFSAGVALACSDLALAICDNDPIAFERYRLRVKELQSELNEEQRGREPQGSNA